MSNSSGNLPSQEERQRFYASVEPRWEEIRTRLAAMRPPDWQGYQFEAKVQDDDAGQISITCSLCDSASNRRYGDLPILISNRLAELCLAYRNFHRMDQLREIRIEQNWSANQKSWMYSTDLVYRFGG